MKRFSVVLLCALLSMQEYVFAEQHFGKKNIERYMGHLYHQSQKARPGP